MGDAATEAVLGVDVGSTEIKALLVDRAGTQLSCLRRPTEWTRSADGAVELPAETLLGRVLSTMDDALRDAGESATAPRVVSVAVTGMAESGVLLDITGAPMHPVIAWFDQRGAAELDNVPESLRRDFSARTGLPLSPLCSFAKLNWLFTNGVPAHRAGLWLNVPEYIAYALGGEAATEPSLASRTGLLDQATQRPWRPALDHLGLPESVIPEPAPAGAAIGTVRHDRAPDGLRGAVVTVAGHDHPVASVASGVWHGEHLFDSCGTSEALLRVASTPLDGEQRDRLSAHGIAQGMHVLRGRWILLGGTRGGFVLDRVLAMLGRHDDRVEFDTQWLSESPGSDSLTISGAHARSEDVVVDIGGAEASPLRVWSAALDHVTRESDTVITNMSAEAGPHQHVTVAGGWQRMASFRAAKARSLPGVRYSRLEQPSAYGAAIFAEQAVHGPAEPTAESVVETARRFHAETTTRTGELL